MQIVMGQSKFEVKSRIGNCTKTLSGWESNSTHMYVIQQSATN